MFLQSGPMCDVCGNYILGLMPDEKLAPFTATGCNQTLLAHHPKCVDIIQGIGDDWKALPDGPLRRMYAKAQAELDAQNQVKEAV